MNGLRKTSGSLVLELDHMDTILSRTYNNLGLNGILEDIKNSVDKFTSTTILHEFLFRSFYTSGKYRIKDVLNDNIGVTVLLLHIQVLEDRSSLVNGTDY